MPYINKRLRYMYIYILKNMYIFSAKEIHCSIIELIHITLSKAHIIVKKM